MEKRYVLTVTPHVGVWIETRMRMLSLQHMVVTPHVGVWIETYSKALLGNDFLVTPHVGVWIETATHWKTPSVIWSHLM